jgi:hypothetical protein
VEKATSALDINLKSTAKVYCDKEIEEKTYTTKLITNIKSYTNGSDTIECFTLVKGELNGDGIMVPPGTTILLWPGEELHDTSLVQLAFVSKFKEDKS